MKWHARVLETIEYEATVEGEDEAEARLAAFELVDRRGCTVDTVVEVKPCE